MALHSVAVTSVTVSEYVCNEREDERLDKGFTERQKIAPTDRNNNKPVRSMGSTISP